MTLSHSLPEAASGFLTRSLGRSWKASSQFFGGQHVVHLIQHGGERVVLKIMPADSCTAWKAESCALRLFADRLPVPQLVDADADESGCYTLTSYVPCLPLSRQLQDRDFPRTRALCEAAGWARIVRDRAAALEASNLSSFRTDSLAKLALGTAAFLPAWEEALGRGVLPLGSGRLEKVMMTARRHISLLDGLERSVQLVHGDFQPRNLLCTGSGSLESIIDWELARFASPLNDIAMLLRFVADDVEEQAVLEEYGKAPHLPECLGQAAALYDLLKVTTAISYAREETPDFPLWLNFVDGCLARLQDSDASALRRAALRLIEF